MLVPPRLCAPMKGPHKPARDLKLSRPGRPDVPPRRPACEGFLASTLQITVCEIVILENRWSLVAELFDADSKGPGQSSDHAKTGIECAGFVHGNGCVRGANRRGYFVLRSCSVE